MIYIERIECDRHACLSNVPRKANMVVVSCGLLDGFNMTERRHESDRSLVNRALLLDWQMFEQDLSPGVRHLCPQCWKKTVLDAIGG